MARLMSCAYTTQQVIDRAKTVTRRLGWWRDKNGRQLVNPADELVLCRKVMGRRKGEPLERIARVYVEDVRRELLTDLLTGGPDGRYPSYGHHEMMLEGFPGMNPERFIDEYFVMGQGARMYGTEVTRIRWSYLAPADPCPTCGIGPTMVVERVPHWLCLPCGHAVSLLPNMGRDVWIKLAAPDGSLRADPGVSPSAAELLRAPARG